MNLILILLSSLLLPCLLGYSVLRLLFQKHPLPLLFHMALSYGVGTGILTHWILLLGAVGITYSEHVIRIPLLIITIFLLIKGRNAKENFQQKIPESKKIDSVDGVLILYVAFYVGVVFWMAWNIPVSVWDAISTNVFVAKVLYFENSLEFFRNFPHNVYPLHLPFLQYWIALNLGAWHDQWINIVLPFYFLSLLGIQYYFVKTFTDRRWGLAGLAMLVTAPLLVYHASVPYRDFTIAYYNTTTILLLVLWSRFKTDEFVWLAALFSGLTTFAKLEGSVYFLLHLLVCLYVLRGREEISFIEKGKKFLKFFLPAFAICAAYHLYKFFSLDDYRQFDPGATDNLNFLTVKIGMGWDAWARIPVAVTRLCENLFLMGNWSIIWVIFFLSLLCYAKYKNVREVKILNFSVLLFFALLLFVFLFTQYFKWIATGHEPLSRTTLHFFPLIPPLICLIHGKRK